MELKDLKLYLVLCSYVNLGLNFFFTLTVLKLLYLLLPIVPLPQSTLRDPYPQKVDSLSVLLLVGDLNLLNETMFVHQVIDRYARIKKRPNYSFTYEL